MLPRHRLLHRQIKRTLGESFAIPLEMEPLLAAVSRAYDESDSDRRMLERSLDLSSQELQEQSQKLQLAQDHLTRVLESSGDALLDLREWARSVGDDVARAIGAEELGIWVVEGTSLVAMRETTLFPPSIAQIEMLSSHVGEFVPNQRIVLPVTGLLGAVHGVVVIEGKSGPWTITEQHLIMSLARQLGGTLELKRLRSDLARAEEHRAVKRRKMIARGVALVRFCPACARCYEHSLSHCEIDQAKLFDPQTPLPCRVGGRYRLIRVIAEGGMGLVFAAHDERLDRQVALKIIRSEQFDHIDAKLRFEQEARALARIDHPGVITIHDSGELEEGSAYLVTELLEGTSLGMMINRHGPGTPAQVASVLCQGADALAAAHGSGLIHRDIKPENIFLIRDDGGFRVKLLDFGLAKPLAATTRLTRSNALIGTPLYMSPEQIHGKRLDARSDLYSFAVVAFEILTGRQLIDASTFGSIFLQILQEIPPRPSEFVPGLPSEIDDAFAAALSKDPADRPATVLAWVGSFASLLVSVPPNVRGWQEAAEVTPVGERTSSSHLAKTLLLEI